VADDSKYDVVLSPTAAAQLRELDGSIRKPVGKTIDKLRERPRELGKDLADALDGYRSIRTAGRYRIIYRVAAEPHDSPPAKGKVEIPCLGIRRDGEKSDIYSVATKLLSGPEDAART
jgi:mRNA-degrading endonuclease RelE of RelBE toxin-antitoxin system